MLDGLLSMQSDNIEVKWLVLILQHTIGKPSLPRFDFSAAVCCRCCRGEASSVWQKRGYQIDLSELC